MHNSYNKGRKYSFIFTLVLIIILSLTLVSCGELNLDEEKIDLDETIGSIDIDNVTKVDVDTFNLYDCDICIHFVDGHEEVVKISAEMVSEEDRQKLTQVGTHTITVTYKGHTKEITVELAQATYYSITYVIDESYPYTSLYEDNPNMYSDLGGDVFIYGVHEQPGTSFLGWYTSPDFEDNTRIDVIHGSDKKNYTLYAKIIPTESPLTYNLNGGVLVGENPATHNFNTETFTLINPTREDYIFTGWKINNGEIIKTVTIEKGDYNSYEFVAVWQYDGNFTVTFNTNGGSTINPIEVHVGDTLTLPENPTKKDCDFDGWYTNAKLTKAFDENTPITNNITLNAKWIGLITDEYTDGLVFALNNESSAYIVTGYTGTESKVVIPKNYHNLYVNTIAEEAFKDNEVISEITFPDTISNIWKGAFSGCTSLTKIKMPDKINTVIESTFEGCTSLTTVDLNKINVISDYAFKDCTSLESIDLSNVVNICGYAFNGCVKLKEIELPSNIESLGAGVFKGCTSLEEITIPNTIMYIMQFSFEGCTSLKTITLSNNLGVIYQEAFKNCTSLESIALPDSLNTVDIGAFENCSLFKSIIFPEYMLNINSNCLKGCTSIESIKYPFSRNDPVSILSLFGGQEVPQTLKKVDASNVNTIEDFAFLECYNLEEVILSNTLESIGKWAFGDCHSLKEINLSYTVSTIGEYAFCRCNSLKNVVLPNVLSTISKGLFSGCEQLTSITIPSNLDTIEEEVLNQITVKTIYVDSRTIVSNIDSIDSFNGLFKDVTSLYVLSGIDDSTTNFIKGYYEKGVSDKDGYVLYTYDESCVKVSGQASQVVHELDATTSADGDLYIEAGIYVNGVFRCNTLAGGYFYLHCKEGDIITSWMYYRGRWWLCIFVYTVTSEKEQSTNFTFNTYLISGRTYYCGVETNAVVKVASADPNNDERYYITETRPNFSIYFVEGSTMYFESTLLQGVHYSYELKDVHEAKDDLEINFLPPNYANTVEAKPYTVSGNISVDTGKIKIEQFKVIEVPKNENTNWSYASLDGSGNFTIKVDNESKLYLYAMLDLDTYVRYIEYIISASVESNINGLDLDLVLYSGIETINTDVPYGLMDTPTKTAMTNKSLNLGGTEGSYSINYYLLTNSTTKTIYTINTMPVEPYEPLGQYTFVNDELTHDFDLVYDYVVIKVRVNNQSLNNYSYNKSYAFASDNVPNSVNVPVELMDKIRGIALVSFNYVLTLEDGVTDYVINVNKHNVEVYFNGYKLQDDDIEFTHVGYSYDTSKLKLDNFCVVNGEKYTFKIKGTTYASSEITINDGDIVVNIINDDVIFIAPKLYYYGADLTSTAVFTYAGRDYDGGEYIYINKPVSVYDVKCTFTLEEEVILNKQFTGNGILTFDYVLEGTTLFSGTVSYNNAPCLAFVTTPQGVFVGNFDGTFGAAVKDGDSITVSILSGANVAGYYETFTYSSSSNTVFNFYGVEKVTYGLFDLSADVREMTFVDITPKKGYYSKLGDVFAYTKGMAQKQYILDINTPYILNSSLTSGRVDIIAKTITVTAKEDGADAKFYLWRNGEDGATIHESSISTCNSSITTSAIVGERLKGASNELSVIGWYFATETIEVSEGTSNIEFVFEKVLVKGNATMNNQAFCGCFNVNTFSATIMFTKTSGFSFYNYRGNYLEFDIFGAATYNYSLKNCEDVVDIKFNVNLEGFVCTKGKVVADGTTGVNVMLYCGIDCTDYYYEMMTITDSDGTFTIFTPSGAAVSVCNGFCLIDPTMYFSALTEDGELEQPYNLNLSKDYVHVYGKFENCTEEIALMSMHQDLEDPILHILYGEEYSLFMLDGSTFMGVYGFVSEQMFADDEQMVAIDGNTEFDIDCTYPD